eukprot:Sdes_comp9281_c0_seq1m765
MEEPQDFAVAHTEDAHYWKTQAKKLETDLTELRRQFDEFQEESRELEHELEAQLEQNENNLEKLQSENSRLKSEKELLSSKFHDSRTDTSKMIADMKFQLTTFQEKLEEQRLLVIHLETTNDHLEKKERILQDKCENLESKLSQALEKIEELTSELEHSVEEKHIETQRLKDQIRDLQNEILAIKHCKKNLDEVKVPPITNASSSAILLVDDLLSRVGMMEERLSFCRKALHLGSEMN